MASPTRRERSVASPGLGSNAKVVVSTWHHLRLDPDFREEQSLWARGFQHVAGVDEVGRGCLAGPVVAGAVILPRLWVPEGLRDSKLLRPDERERLAAEIRQRALAYSLAFVASTLIDRINILKATLLATQLALGRLSIRPDAVILDAIALPELRLAQRALVDADRLCASVAAASVLAKVARDRLMVQLDAVYPGYALASNKGYAAPDHREGLFRQGPCPIHRRSFLTVAASIIQGSLWPEDGETQEADGVGSTEPTESHGRSRYTATLSGRSSVE